MKAADRKPWGEAALVSLWALLLAGILAGPREGPAVTRQTIWLALGCYALAGAWLLTGGPRRLARWAWTLGWLTYVLHVLVAFHHYHHWSHDAAVEHVRRESGFGPGIFFSHLFTAAWGLDVAAWWLAPVWHERRPRWLTGLLHAYLAFILFNGTVVFEEGTSRWLGVTVFLALGGCGLLGWMRRHPGGETPGAFSRPPPS